MKNILRIVFAGLLAATHVPAQAADFSRVVKVHVFRPDVFADRYLGLGIPASRSVLQGVLWYLRMDESVRLMEGMDSLARLIRYHRVPGLDFNGHKTLSNADLEMLFRPEVWTSRPVDPTHKFQLLKLAGTPTDDRAMPVIGRLFDLQVLGLSERVTDKGIQFLSKLKQLRILTVPGIVTDESVPIFSQLNNLQTLSVKTSVISDDGLRGLTALPLKRLELGPRITDQGIAHLKAMKTLEHLDVHASKVSGVGLDALAQLPIHTLFLGPSFSDRDVPSLAQFKSLTRLDLTGTDLTDASIPALSQLTQLEELALTGTDVTNKVVEALSQLPRLRYLEISGTLILPAGFEDVKGFPSLKVLSFSYKARVKATDLRPFGRFPQLHSLIINNTLVGPDLIRYLQSQGETRSMWDALIPKVYAAESSDNDLEKVLEVASLPEEKAVKPFKGFRGLPLIHESEASLNEVIAAPPTIQQDDQQYSEKNFLGEISVGATSPKQKTK